MATFRFQFQFVFLCVLLQLSSAQDQDPNPNMILDPPESWPDVAPFSNWSKTILGWGTVLPACPQVTDVLSVASCINSFGPDECFQVETVDPLSTCLLNEFSNNDTGIVITTDIEDIAAIEEAVVNCLNPLYDCYVQQTQMALEELPLCVRASTRKLALCLTENALTCGVDCLVDQSFSSLFDEDLEASDLVLCSGIQDSIMDPLCEWMQCCLPCLPYVEEAAECVANEVLDRGDGLIFDTACDFVCVDSTTTNGTATRSNANTGEGNARGLLVARTANETDVDAIYRVCRTLVPGLYGDSLARERLLARSNYFDCLVEEMIKILQTNFISAAPTPLTTSSPSSPSSSPGYPGVFVPSSFWLPFAVFAMMVIHR